MEDQVARLTDKAYNLYTSLPPSRRLIIAIGGIPGSGKTTLATALVSAINTRHTSSRSPGLAGPVAALLSLDGFHLPRAALAAQPDPATAFARRGAAFTFDAPAYLAMLRALRAPLTPESRTLYAPSFDHAVKDPVADDVPLGVGARVVLVEGNYVALDDGDGAWRAAAALCDEVWFVECEEEVARGRLVRRHVASGIEADEASAAARVEGNDLVNGREIVAGRWGGVSEVVVSTGDGGWVQRVQRREADAETG